MSQLAENPELKAVFDDLFDEAGLRDLPEASRRLRTNSASQSTSTRCSNRRVGAEKSRFGYRLLAQASDASKAYGVVINPDKTAPISFTDEDKIIVLAED